MYRFNAKKFIKSLGGPTSIARDHARLLKPLGYPELSKNTIISWQRDNTIRFIRLPDLFHLAAIQNIPWHFDDFFEEVT